MLCAVHGLVLALASATTAAAVHTPPHVVLLYADDLGYNDLGVVGRHTGASASPHIDAIAKVRAKHSVRGYS